LEPDFDVLFCQVEVRRQFDAPWTSDVAVEVELLLQLQKLGARVGSSCALILVEGLEIRA
jgi:hypothetical protein